MKMLYHWLIMLNEGGIENNYYFSAYEKNITKAKQTPNYFAIYIK